MTSGHKWPEVPLGDVCELKYGKSLPASKRVPGPAPVFGSNGIVGRHNKALTAGPTIVIGRKGSFGEVHLSSAPCWPIDTTYYVDGSATEVDLRWLAYRLRGLGLTELNRAAAVPGLNRDDAYRQRLLLPPQPEQRRIADVLDAADVLRSNRRTAIKEVRALPQSMFDHEFGPSSDASKWPYVHLSDVASTVTKGTTPTSIGYSYAESGIPFVRAQNIADGVVNTDLDPLYLAPEVHRAMARSTIRPGDVTVSIAGTIGRVGLVPDNYGEMNCNQAVAVIRPIRDLALPEYLTHWLTSQAAQVQIREAQVTATVTNLSLGELRALKLQLPSIAEQERFVMQVREAERLSRRVMKSRDGLDALFLSIEQRAFSGEI